MVQSTGLFIDQIVVRVQVPIRKRPSRDQPQRVLFNRTVNMSLTTSNPKAPTHHPLPSLIPLQSHSEALHHLRASLIAILSISVISALLPLPTPLQAFGVVSGWSVGDVEEGGGGWGWWLGLSYAGSLFVLFYRGGSYADLVYLELTVLSILILNVAQSTYTLRYPRTSVPFPPPPTPTPGAKTKNNRALMTPVNNSSKVKRKLSPNVRPPPLPFYPSHLKLYTYTYPSGTNRPPLNPNNNSHSPHPTHPHHSQHPLAPSTTPSLPPPHNHLLYPNLVRLRSRLRPLRRGGILWGVVLRVRERGLGVRWRRIEGDMLIVLDVSFFVFSVLLIPGCTPPTLRQKLHIRSISSTSLPLLPSLSYPLLPLLDSTTKITTNPPFFLSSFLLFRSFG